MFSDFIGPASARSYKIGVFGNDWLVGWLLTQFSQKQLKEFFCFFTWSQGTIKVEKSQSRSFEKKFLIWRYSRKSLQINPKSDTLIFFSKTALMIFWVFGLKLILNININLNETYFWENFAIWKYLTSKLSKKIAPTEVFGYFLDFASLVFIGGHDVFLQFTGPFNVFLFYTFFVVVAVR